MLAIKTKIKIKKPSELLIEASKDLLSVNPSTHYICLAVRQAAGVYTTRQIPNEQEYYLNLVLDRITEYMKADNPSKGTYIDYLAKVVDRPELLPPVDYSSDRFKFIQFLRAKLCLFLAEEFKAKGE